MKSLFPLLLVLAAVGLTNAAAAQPAKSLPAPDRSAQLAIPPTDDGLPGAGPIRRLDWFREKWLGHRTKWAQRVPADQGAVVFLGDSITDLWNDSFDGDFGGLKVVNRGISGDTTRGVLIRMHQDVLSLHPRAVVLMIGTNDLEEQAEPETIVGNLKLILAELKKYDPKLPVILCQLFPSSPALHRPPEKIKEVNALYLAAVRGDPQITFLETWPLFANAEGNAKPEEFPDLLHPNKAGYAKWAAAVKPVFATLGLTDTASDTFALEPSAISLFNGRDLTGWGFRPTPAAEAANIKQRLASDPNAPAMPLVTEPLNFDGKTATPDGRFAAINGRLVIKTPPEYRRLQKLWTTREFPQNFVLKLEFRATPNADSGVYLRGPQLQCRDYLLAGPYKGLKNYKPQDWNELVVTVKDGVARCTCNGEVLESEFKLPATGPIGLEGDRGQMEYRRIRLLPQS